ncbi:low specificity L-threonine aldolase [bacterium]|nr:low specificity L-threonine aldolase [bacterium]
MWEAMRAAELGDDVLGDDPTVRRLEDRVAGLLGKEAAVYTPSGTMANQCAVGAQVRPGQALLLEATAHIYFYEGGAPSALWGAHTILIPGDGGAFGWAQVATAMPPDDVHFATPALLSLENTHNKAGGRIFPQPLVEEVSRAARAHGLRVHLDGARLWNVHVATGLALADLCGPVDTVSVCFSKGLGAPVGSCLAGDLDTIEYARRLRKRLGGGMRQAGMLAAGCLYALDYQLDRLAEDHAHARRIADDLDNALLGVSHPVETNIVMVDVAPPGDAEELLEHLASHGVAALAVGTDRIRLIPCLGVDGRAMDTVLDALNSYREGRA